jgi:hypothetical protein
MPCAARTESAVRRFRRRCSLVACTAALVLALSGGALHAEPHEGQLLRDALLELNADGAGLLFSSEYVSPQMRVVSTPAPGDPLPTARAILAPHRLTIVPGPGSLWLVTRSTEEATQHGDRAAAPSPQDLDGAAPRIDELQVIASRYRLYGSGQGTEFEHAEVDQLPHLADDLMRAISRLPAVASGDFSARINLRGGTREEASLYLDGLKLVDPFHLKDLQGAFSIVDSNLVDRVDVLPGGLPAMYGDSTSGIVSIHSLPPPEDEVYSVGISFINAFANARGSFDDGDGGWMVSLRRGYLDWLLRLIDTGQGEFSPSYLDFLAKLEHDLGDRHVVSAQVLSAGDDLNYLDDSEGTVVAGRSDTLFAWTRLSSYWTDAIRSDLILWSNKIERTRDSRIDDTDNITADVHDRRDMRVSGLRSDWQVAPHDDWQLGFGFDWSEQRVDYDYRLASTTNAPGYPMQPPIDRQSVLRVAGEVVGLYASVRRDFGPLRAELGYRWDRERYTGRDEDVSGPRLNMQYELAPGTRLLFAWGDYHQFQPAEALQVEDGIEQFYGAALAEHRTLGLEHRFDADFSLRADAYQKRYRKLRPRYTNLYDSYEPIPEAEPDRFLVAADTAEARGLEITLKRRREAGFSWWASYTFSSVEDRIDGVDIEREWDQPHALNLVLNWQGPRWNFNVASAWHSGWPRTDPQVSVTDTPGGPQIEIAPGERNANRYADYLRVDFRVSRNVKLTRGTFTYFFELYNVFDTENPCCIDEIALLPGPALDINEENWLPRLPSFGFSWTFR